MSCVKMVGRVCLLWWLFASVTGRGRQSSAHISASNGAPDASQVSGDLLQQQSSRHQASLYDSLANFPPTHSSLLESRVCPSLGVRNRQFEHVIPDISSCHLLLTTVDDVTSRMTWAGTSCFSGAGVFSLTQILSPEYRQSVKT